MKLFRKKRKHRPEGGVELMVARRAKLMELAGQDHSYRVWLGEFAETKAEFARYMDAQTPEIQSMLCATLGTCELYYQRVLELACANMEFTDPKNRK